MDPMVMTTAITGILASCAIVSDELNELKIKHRDARVTIEALNSQIALVTESLESIQRLCFENPNSIISKLQGQHGELLQALDITLVGTTAILSLMENEIQKLSGTKRLRLAWIGKSKDVWNENLMTDMWYKMMGQVPAFHILFDCLSTESMAQINLSLYANQFRFRQIANNTAVIRHTVQVPHSVFNLSQSASSTAGDAPLQSRTRFSFDNAIVNSTAYRRVLNFGGRKHNDPKSFSGESIAETDDQTLTGDNMTEADTMTITDDNLTLMENDSSMKPFTRTIMEFSETSGDLKKRKWTKSETKDTYDWNMADGGSSSKAAIRCQHKLKAGCNLSNPKCCACLDARKYRTFNCYETYVDGEGMKVIASRWNDYCSNCKKLWDTNAAYYEGNMTEEEMFCLPARHLVYTE